MFIVIRKTAAPGHSYGTDDYYNHSCTTHSTLEAAVAEYRDWCNTPPNKFGYNSAQIFRNGLPNDKEFADQIRIEVNRQKGEASQVDNFLTAAGM